MPANVKPSNPFGIALAADLLYVADAAQNLVRAVGIESGSVATIATFPPQPNPLPFGPPVYEAVPDNVRLFGDQLLVPFLTGFPFPQGRAEIRKIDLVAGGNGAPFITGLTAAIASRHPRGRRGAFPHARIQHEHDGAAARAGPPLALRDADLVAHHHRQ